MRRSAQIIDFPDKLTLGEISHENLIELIESEQ
jgi:hypothetical protein